MAIDLPKLSPVQWGLVITGGVGIGLAIRWWNGRQSTGGSEEELVDLLAEQKELLSVGLPGSSTGGYAGWTVPSDAPPSSSPGGSIDSSNADWHVRVAGLMLKALNNPDPILIDGALATYLEGKPLDAAQYAVVLQAIQLFGYPPNPPGVPQKKPEQAAPTPVPVPAPVPAPVPIVNQPITMPEPRPPITYTPDSYMSMKGVGKPFPEGIWYRSNNVGGLGVPNQFVIASGHRYDLTHGNHAVVRNYDGNGRFTGITYVPWGIGGTATAQDIHSGHAHIKNAGFTTAAFSVQQPTPR
jgi:hypothetical protein